LIHLDTSFLIRAMARESAEDRKLRGWLNDGFKIGISAIGWAEFLCGPLSAEDLRLARRLLTAIEPLIEGDGPLSARLFNVSGRRRGSLVDCMIAAIAIRLEASLATTNRADFRRFESEGLNLA